MKQRISEETEMLKIEDIHPHWRFEKFIRDHHEVIIIENDNEKNFITAINELLRINELIIIKSSNRFSKAKNKKKRTPQQTFEKFTQRESSEFEHILRQRQWEIMITINQMIDQKNITAANEFFEIMNVITTREESVTRDVTRDVTRGVITRERDTWVIQQSSRRRDKNEESIITRGRQRDIATSVYMKDNEIMFNSFQL